MGGRDAFGTGWRSEGSTPELVLAFHLPVASGVGTLVGLSGKCLLAALHSLPFRMPFSFILFGCVTLDYWGPLVSPKQQSQLS